MKRSLTFLISLCMLVVPVLACNLGASGALTPTPVIPTLAPAFSQPTFGLSPIFGAPGTIITVSAAGFTPGTRVKLLIGTLTKTGTTPIYSLIVGESGTLKFNLQLPNMVNETFITNNMPLIFTLQSEAGNVGASALFLALTSTSSGQPTSVPIAQLESGQNLYITSPEIDSVQYGLVLVTGSGSSTGNQVMVEVLDENYQRLGGQTTSILSTPGTVGPWQASISYTTPYNQQVGYIKATTSDNKGASIRIILAGTAQNLGVKGAIPILYPTVPKVP